MKFFLSFIAIAFFSVFPLYGESFEVDERKVDLYYANGILGLSYRAERQNWVLQVDRYKLANPLIDRQTIGEIDVAYNTSHSAVDDLFESFLQKKDENQDISMTWLAFQAFVGRYFSVGAYAVRLDEAVVNTYREHDLSKQIEKYQRSIWLGHRVVIIAHSQGNLFTNEAYKKLDGWMIPYFKVMGVATPSDRVPGTGPYVTFDNDPILYVPHSLGWSDENPMRYYEWSATSGTDVDDSATVPCPNIKLPIGETPTCHDPDWIAVDSKHSDFHSFDYYMSTAPTKGKIYTLLTTWIREHKTAPSQWKVKQATGCGCNRRVSLTHIEPTTNLDHLVEGVHAISFNENGKLYQIPDETNTSIVWVKGSPEGTNIAEAMSPETGVCYLLEGTEEEITGYSEFQEVKNGIITVQLTWDDTEIDMNLDVQMPFGEKDVSGGCERMEHFYVASANDVVTGTYPVYVNNGSGADESLLPENVYLAIGTPGEAITFDFNITTSDMLNIGHVVDIIIKEDKKVEFVHTPSGSGNLPSVTRYGGSSSSADYKEYIYEIQSRLKQATLGPLSNAVIELSYAAGFEANEPLYVSATTGGNSLLTSGVFYFPSTVLSALGDEKFYVLSVKGGDDIDANDDGTVDSNPTHNNGIIRAIVSGHQLKNDDFKVNILTEVAYQLTKEMLQSELNATALTDNLDEMAQKLLIGDVNSDETVDYNDLLHWLPMFDKEKLLKDYDTFYESIVQKVYIEQDIYDEAYALVNEPIFRKQEVHASENIVAGAVLGKIRVDLYGGPVNYTLSGDYSDFFEIAEDGTVILSNTASLDYETIRDYTINLSADIDTQTLHASLVVTIDDVLDAPLLGGFRSYIDENSQPGTHIGQLYVDPGLDTVTEILLQGDGNEHFTVDLEGNIAIASEAVLDYEVQTVYRLQAVAYNSYGHSWPASMTIFLNDLPESPVLQTLTASVREDVLRGTVVGTVEIIENGSPTTSIQLSGDGYENFNIDSNGTVTVSQIANLDFTSRAVYTLSAQATNVYGPSQGVVIIIHLVPAAPALIGSYDTSDYVMNVILSTDKMTAYIANGRNGLQIIDITDPMEPSQIGSYKTPSFASRVVLSTDGSMAYVVDYYNGLQIIDITDPTTPSLIGNIDTPSYGQNITLSSDETIVYYTTIYNGLQIIDVSNPISPFLITSYNTSGYPYDVALAANGTVAYVSNHHRGLLVLDVTDPALPLKIGSYATSGYALHVTLSEDENIAYVASGSGGGLEIIDVSTPSIPKYVGNYDTPGYSTYGVTLSSDENIAYVANDDSGIQMIDISDPSLPVYRNSFDTLGSTRDIALSANNSIAYVADGNNSLVIISVGF